MSLRTGRSGGLAVLVLLLLVSFQNCSQQKDNLHILSSTQCRAQLKDEFAAQKKPASVLQCGDYNNYSCERRVFSPEVENLQHTLKECSAGGQACVDVEVHQFNTAGLRSDADPSQFQPGGDYNREEIKCYHHMLLKGMAVFEGDGDSLEESLAAAMAACEKAQEGT